MQDLNGFLGIHIIINAREADKMVMKVNPNEKRKELSSFGKFVNFDTMITPSLIKILYAIGFFVITITGIERILYNLGIGLTILIFGNCFWRIICENVILFFSIHDNLIELKESRKISL